MKRQFVQMTGQGAKAYYQAQKAQRREAAEHYRDHPEMLLSQVAAKFSLPMSSMRKGLAENGIETDRARQYGRKQRRFTCPDCSRVVFHACQDQAESVIERVAQRHERIDPRRIHPVTGKIVERTPEYIAYVEGSMPWEPPAEPGREYRLEDNYLPGDTPEMREYAVLGLEGIMDRVRAGLGIK